MKYERYTRPIPPSPMESLIREQVNLQCAAARQRPRSMRDFESRAIALATTIEAAAASCLSVHPLERKAGGAACVSRISVLMAEIIGVSYGNLRVDGVLIEDAPRMVTARGIAHDMESDFAASSDISEPTVTADGMVLDERKRAEIARMAVAKARRAAIVKVAPTTVCKAVEDACREMLFGNDEACARTLASIAAWLNAAGIPKGRVWRALGIAGEEELDAGLAAMLIGLRTAITDGDTTLDEAFPACEEAPRPRAPRFIPPRDDAPSRAAGEPRASAAARLGRLVEACRMNPKTILEYLHEKGQGTYRSFDAAPEPVLTAVVCAWPDVVAEIAEIAGTRRE